jgi:hypothetical protein
VLNGAWQYRHMRSPLSGLSIGTRLPVLGTDTPLLARQKLCMWRPRLSFLVNDKSHFGQLKCFLSQTEAGFGSSGTHDILR